MIPPDAVVVPGTRPARGEFAERHGLSVGVTPSSSRIATPAPTRGSPSRTRCGDGLPPARAARRRPRGPATRSSQRPARGTRRRGAGGRRRHAVLRLRPRRGHAPGRRPCGPSLPPASTSRTPSRRTRTSRSSRAWRRWASAPTWPRAGSCATRSRAGFAAARVVVTGPGKSDAELRAAVEAGVRGRHRRVAGRAAPARRDRRVARPAPAGAAARRRVGGAPPRARPDHRRRRRRQVRDGRRRTWGSRPRRPRLAVAGAARRARVRRLQRHRCARRSSGTSGRRSSRRCEWPRQAGVPARAGRCRRRPRDPVQRHGDELDVAALGARPGAARRARWAADRGSAARRASCSSPAGSSWAGRARTWPACVDRKLTGGRHVVILDGGIHHVLRPALVGQEHRIRVLTGRAACGVRSASGSR